MLGRSISHIGILSLAIAISLMTSAVCAEDQRETTVGMSAPIDQLVLPGSELEVRPLENPEDPMIVRIVETFPHGDSFRYDIVYYGLEPGKYDLRTLLKRKDGSSTEDLPSIMVEVFPILPPGQVEPNQLPTVSTSVLGGYQKLLIFGGIVWVIGLVLIGYLIFKKDAKKDTDSSRPKTLADRLRPIVLAAIEGKLDQQQQAELERMLLAYWRKRLSLEDLSAAEAMISLKNHEEAGALLRQLEEWLHSPRKQENINLAELLSPYQDLPADEFESSTIKQK
jgi:hypothetical protein